MAKIIIPTPLRKFTNNEATFIANGSTVNAAITELITKFPSIKQHLLDESGKIRSFVNIFVGDNDIRILKKEETPVDANSLVSIVPAIAGGCS
jgi:sulfur-carrier protein